jgi:hypothetical protein
MSFVRYRKGRKWAFQVIAERENYMKVDLACPFSEFCFLGLSVFKNKASLL